jgi:hypothetical protein
MELLLWGFCLGVLVVYLLPYFTKGEDNTLYYWDIFTFIPFSYLPLIRENKIFARNSDIVDQICGGMRRSGLRSEFDLFLWLLKSLGFYRAIVAQRVILTAVAFGGMYLLLTKPVFDDYGDPVLILATCLCFAMLPFHISGMAMCAGIPLLAWAFLDIRCGDAGWSDWLVVALTPFYSSLFLSGVFVLFSCGIIFIYDSLVHGPNTVFLLAMLVHAATHVLCNHRLFTEVLFNREYVPARQRYSLARLVEAIHPGAWSWLQGVRDDIFFGSVFAFTYVKPAILIATGVALAAEAFVFGESPDPIFSGLVALCLAVPVAANYVWINPRGRALFDPFFRCVPIDPSRFYTLYPAAWYVVFALSLDVIRHVAPPFGWYAALSIIVLQCVRVFFKNETRRKDYGLTFRSYFAEELYADVRRHIGRPTNTYRTLSIGLDAAIAAYNGLRTVDGNLETCETAYVEKFYRMTKPETNRSHWSRMMSANAYNCMVYASELDFFRGMLPTVYRAGNGKTVELLALDYRMLYEMGCQYILSSVRINSTNNPGLRFESKFTHPEAAWDVYLYVVDPEEYDASLSARTLAANSANPITEPIS